MSLSSIWTENIDEGVKPTSYIKVYFFDFRIQNYPSTSNPKSLLVNHKDINVYLPFNITNIVEELEFEHLLSPIVNSSLTK